MYPTAKNVLIDSNKDISFLCEDITNLKLTFQLVFFLLAGQTLIKKHDSPSENPVTK
jgi:hypothetical protein